MNRDGWTVAGTIRFHDGTDWAVWSHPDRPRWVYLGTEPWGTVNESLITVATAVTALPEFTATTKGPDYDNW